MIPTPLYIGWAVALYLALAALLKWKYRRTRSERRISRGLRVYTAGSQPVAMTATAHS